MSERSSADIKEEVEYFCGKVIETAGESSLDKRQIRFTYSITMTVELSGVVTLPQYSGNCANGNPSLSTFDVIRKITLYSASMRRPAETRLSDIPGSNTETSGITRTYGTPC